MQKERSPCLAASIATTVKPAALKESATRSICPRPPPRPWRQMSIGEHCPKGVSGPVHAGALPSLGTEMSTLIFSLVVVPAALNAPLAGSSRLKVVMVVSMISEMLELGTIAESTPYFTKAAAGVSEVMVPVLNVVSPATLCRYGSAPICVATPRMLCVLNVYAIATPPLLLLLFPGPGSAAVSTGLAAASTGLSVWRITSRAPAVALSMPVSWELPVASTSGLLNWRIDATVPLAGGAWGWSSTMSLITTAYMVVSLSGRGLDTQVTSPAVGPAGCRAIAGDNPDCCTSAGSVM